MCISDVELMYSGHLRWLWLLCITLTFAGCRRENALVKIMKSNPAVWDIAQQPEHEVQILYTRVNLKDTTFKSYSFQLDPKRYFYPASTVKMPVAFLTLEKIKLLNDNGVDMLRTDDMLTAVNRPVQTPAFRDSTTQSGKPNLERYIQKLFAVSDNDAYNRLYEFLGADNINNSLRNKGIFQESVINHRVGVSGYSYEENRHTNNVRFFRDGKVLYDKPEAHDSIQWMHHAMQAIKGRGYIDPQENTVNEPFDFSKKNFYTIHDMEATLKRVIFPEKFRPEERFDISAEDYNFLKRALSDLPRSYPFYASDPDTYYDSYVKFLIFGDNKLPIPDEIKIYNKVGIAYGYMTDCAYIVDTKANVAFFLTATIHVNKNGVYNDGIYEYEEVGLPFMTKLGHAVLMYEWKMKK